MTADTLRPCYCPCHTHPGTYFTSPQRPCYACGHVNSEGHMIGGYRDGWAPGKAK